MADYESWEPNLGQALYYNSEHPNKLAKGAVRSGKSVAGTCDDIKATQLYPGIKILVTRTTQTALYQTAFQDFMNWCPQRLIDGNPKKTTTDITIYMRNGSQLIFKAFEEHDIEKVRSLEFGQIRVEEANLITEYMYSLLQTRLSQTVGIARDQFGRNYHNTIPQEAHQMKMITNPGGRDWIWRLFDRDHPKSYLGEDPEYFAVRMKTAENLHHLSPDFWARLQTLPEHIYKRFVEADDAPFEGLVFPMFDRKIHILSMKNFIPPPHWPVYIGIDFGVRNNTHVTWTTVTEEGHWICFMEYVNKGATVRVHAEAIRAITANMLSRGMGLPKMIVIDPSTAQSKGEGERTVFQQFMDEGLSGLMPGKRETKEYQGITYLMNLLSPNPQVKHPLSGESSVKGYAQLMFTEDCPKIIAEFEEWQWMEHKQEKKDAPEKPQEKNDHGIDSLKHIILLGLSAAPADPTSQFMKMQSFAYQQQKLIDRDLKGRGRNGGYLGRIKASGVIS